MKTIEWEYKVLCRLNNLHEGELNELGSIGWEMCGVHVTRDTEVTIYFKRPKKE